MDPKVLKIILVLPVLLHSSLLLQVEEKVIDYTDSWHQFSDCFFKIVCELDQGLSVRGPVALCSNKTIEYVHELILKIHPRELSFTVADLMSEKFWTTTSKYVFCDLNTTEIEKMQNDYGSGIMHYYSAVCTDRSRKEECEKTDVCSAKYMEFYNEKIRNGECGMADEMLPVP